MAALRLKEKYAADVVPALRKEFGYGSPMAVPRVAAVKLNMGIGKQILQRRSVGLRRAARRPSRGTSRRVPGGRPL